MRFHLCRAGLLALLAMCASCSSKEEASEDVNQAAQGNEPAGAAAGLSSEEAKDAIARGLKQIIDDAAKLPRTEFDPDALATSLGKDPRKLLDWVRENTHWVPYRGLLRGSRGVLLDRSGSSLDRAVLLGDLLRRSGYTVRLARARLPEDRARRLLVQVSEIPATRAAQADSSRVVEEANTLARSQLELLQAKARALATSDKEDDQAALDALRDHWWVEREDQDKWIVMDVVFPDSGPGETLPAASQKSSWDSAEGFPAIPESEWHAVQLRVLVERYESGNITEEVALETLIRPAVALDRPVKFGHMPLQWPESVPASSVDPNALGNAAVNVREWAPYLKIGDEFVSQSAFDEHGNVNTEFLNAQRDISKVGGGSVFGGFDDALSGGAARASSSLTAEWIEYEIRAPGMPNQRLRRAVFDLLGPANRTAKVADFDAATNERLIQRSEALLGTIDVLLQPCGFTAAFVAHLETASVVANQDAFRELLNEEDSAKAKELASRLIGRLDAWGPLPVLARLRGAIGSQAGDWFVDRPNILNYRVSPPVVNADREPLREVIDIAANGIGVRKGSGRTPFDVRLQQGVIDTVAEAVVLGGELREVENTASLFASAGTDVDGSKLVPPRHADAARELGWPADVMARLVDDVEGGFAALVPTGSFSLRNRNRIAWWRIDPATGETIGVLDSGFHGANEDAQLRSQLQVQKDNLLRAYARNNDDRIEWALRTDGRLPDSEFARLTSRLLRDLQRYIDLLG